MCVMRKPRRKRIAALNCRFASGSLNDPHHIVLHLTTLEILQRGFNAGISVHYYHRTTLIIIDIVDNGRNVRTQ